MRERVRVWRCGACGHEVVVNDQLEGLSFEWFGELTSKVTCLACGSYTIQRAYNDRFTRGEFLIVRSKRKVIKKGR